MRSVFVVEVTVDTGDLDPTDLCEDVERSFADGIDHCSWAHDGSCEVLDVYPAPRETRDVQSRLL